MGRIRSAQLAKQSTLRSNYTYGHKQVVDIDSISYDQHNETNSPQKDDMGCDICSELLNRETDGPKFDENFSLLANLGLRNLPFLKKIEIQLKIFCYIPMEQRSFQQESKGPLYNVQN